jgi:uncharacterized OsmC-like protein
MATARLEPMTETSMSHTLFVSPGRGGKGFLASIRGHQLELADPTEDGLAPTPEDLLVAAVAADVAWTARRFLEARELTGDVDVSAVWRTLGDPPRLDDVSLTVTVSKAAEATSDALLAALEERFSERSLHPLRFRLDYRA